MAQLNVEIPDELHKRLKLIAVREEITLRDLVVSGLIRAVDHVEAIFEKSARANKKTDA